MSEKKFGRSTLLGLDSWRSHDHWTMLGESGIGRGIVLLFLSALLGIGWWGARAWARADGGPNPLPATEIWQIGANNRVLISTLVGGGFTTENPALKSPMGQPTATVLDPLGRGVFLVEERDSTSLLRFVNTTSDVVVIGGRKIASGSIHLIAGGGVGAEGAPLEEVELSQVTGIAIDPDARIVYLLTPLLSSIRALNIGESLVTIFGVTIEPNRFRSILTLSRSDARGLAISPDRQLYFTAAGPLNIGRAVYRVDGSGGGLVAETLVAGGGTQGGEGGAAELATLVNPISVAVDRLGRVYIAEAGDTRLNPGKVRRISLGGNLETLLTDLEFPIGISLDPTDTPYVTLGGSQQIVRLTANGGRILVAGSPLGQRCTPSSNPTCGDGGPALSARLNLPGSIQFRNITLAVGPSVIYLPDLEFRRLRAINLSGGSVTLGGIEVGAGTIQTIAGNGLEAPYDQVPARATELQRPTGVTVDALGNLFLTDSSASPYNLLRYVNRGSAPVTLFAGTSWAMTAQPGEIISLNHQVGMGRSDNRITTAVFLSPGGVAATPEGLFIVDSQYGALIRSSNSLSGRRSGHIRFLNTTSNPVVLFPQSSTQRLVVLPGQIEDVVGRNDSPGPGITGDGGPSKQAVIFPSDVAIDEAGNLLIADQGHNLIRRVDRQTGVISSVLGGIGQPQNTPLTTNAAAGIAFGAGRIHIADTRNDRILRQDTPGGTSFSVIANLARGISRPRGLMVDAAGHVLVVNNGSQRIVRIVAPSNELGTVVTVAGTGSAGFSGDEGRAQLGKINLINPGTAINEVQYPTQIVALSQFEVAFADTVNNRIRLLTQLPNRPPELRPIADLRVREGETVTVSLLATDPDEDPLTIRLEGAPAFVTLSHQANGEATVRVQPGFEDAGSHPMTITVSDGEATLTSPWTVTVEDVNRPPVVRVQPIPTPLEATSAAGRSVVLSGIATDPDGDTVTYQWFNRSVQIAGTPDVTVVLGMGSHSLFLLARDSKGLSVTSPPQEVEVRDTTPPALSELPANLTTPASSVDGAIVSFPLPVATDLVDGVVPVIAVPASGSLFPVGVTTVRFSATDTRGNMATASLTLTVTPLPGGGGGGGGGNNDDEGEGESGGNGTDPVSGSKYTITTVAGTGATGTSGNGGPALNATFRQLTALAPSQNGQLLLADLQARAFRLLSLTDGSISSLAGNGNYGNFGDNNFAPFATFGHPSAIVADSKGNIYLADSLFNRIRVIHPDGRVRHFAGSTSGASGSIGDQGLAFNARLNGPSGLAIDANDNLYIADTLNHRVRRVDTSSGIISTFVGTGGLGFNGDGLPADRTTLHQPTGLAFDRHGNLLIADRLNHRLRRVDASSGLVSTLAGNGSPGFAGDGGPASVALLDLPTDIASDNLGNLFVIDFNNHRLRRISPAGIISTLAGDGTPAFAGDDGDSRASKLNNPRAIAVLPDGQLFLADSGNQRIRRLSPVSAGPLNRPPSFLSSPSDLSLTVGEVLDLPLSADDPDGDPVSFSFPDGPSFASILSPDPAARTATLRLAPTTPGSFPALRLLAEDARGESTLSSPFSITVLPAPVENRPPVVSVGELGTTLEATSPAGVDVLLSGSATDPDGDQLSVSWFNNGLLIATQAQAMVKLALGPHSLVFRATDSRGATGSSPPIQTTVVDTTAPVITAVPVDQTIEASSAAGAIVSFPLPVATDLVDGVVPVIAVPAPGSLFPVGVTTVRFSATDTRGNMAAASFTVTVRSIPGGTTRGETYTITTVAGTGATGTSGNGGPALNATFRQLTALAPSQNGQLLLADLQARAFRLLSLTDGSISSLAGNGNYGNFGDNNFAPFATFGHPSAIVADSKGNIYLADSLFNRIRVIHPDGRVRHFAGSTSGASGSIGDQGLAFNARLNGPSGLAIDANDNLYIADTLNHRVRRVDTSSGIISTFVGTGGLGFNGDGLPADRTTLHQPTGLAFDRHGNLLIADRLNHRLRRVDASSGLVSTLAGNGSPGFAGDGGPASVALLDLPTDIASDNLGNLFVIDFNNHRLRRISPAGIISTLAGDGTPAFAGDDGDSRASKLNNPRAIAVLPDGQLFLADSGNQRIRRLSPVSAGPLNRPPSFLSSPSDLSLTVGEVLDLPLSADDPDGDPVSFSFPDGPSFASIVAPNPIARTATLRLTPTTPGSFPALRLRAEDAQGEATFSAPFSITVLPAPVENRPPTALAAAIPAVLVSDSEQGVRVRLDGSGSSDPDGDPLSFQWSVNGTIVAVTALAEVWLPVGTHSIVLTVEDGRGGRQSTEPQVVRVEPPPGSSDLAIDSISPPTWKRGRLAAATITGRGFQPGVTVSMPGGGVSILVSYVSPGLLNLRISILSNATTGVRDLILQNRDGSTVILKEAFTIVP
jgi:sugar lactone lactonase YvrE